MPGLRILLADDETDSLDALTRLLVNARSVVHAATTVADALAFAAAEGCDLLVSDIGLPDRSGVDLMRELRRLYAMPGIALTGFGDDDCARRCQEAGFGKHLVKPIDFDKLLTAIKELSRVDPAADTSRDAGDKTIIPPLPV